MADSFQRKLAALNNPLIFQGKGGNQFLINSRSLTVRKQKTQKYKKASFKSNVQHLKKH